MEEEEEGGSAAIKEDEEKKIASFLEEIKDLTILPSMLELKWGYMHSTIWMGWITSMSRMKLRGIDLGEVRHYSDAEICDFTNRYSEDNIFCLARNGRLFKARGYNNRKLAVRTLDVSSPFSRLSYLTPPKLHADIVLLRDPLIKSHPNFVKLIGYSCERMLAFVFDLDPKTRVHELLTSDDFGWDARMKDLNAKFFDFGFHKRVKNKDEKFEAQGFYKDLGYYAPEVYKYPVGMWSMKSDVCAYGILLLNLVCKKQGATWFYKLIKSGNVPVVSDSFKMDEHAKSGIIGLAMLCVNKDPTCRPDMGTVVKNLEDLIAKRPIVARHGLIELDVARTLVCSS
ncbi:cysteine-rich receptor-like protein kinase 13 [Striga asiatica]|uniref:Cysteine-rich receptor-like protein kinase 13 n=1 Tax=Striga asiatica TaxID=4170 RepID=A0A5A7QTL0_STRAF|nr:cysteine-rich receptor-like protein kinase 13 [Striga asiatica]